MIIVCYCTLRTKIILKLLSDFNLSNILSWVTIQRIGPHESQVQRYLTSSNQHWFFCHLENIQTANIHHKVDTFWYLKQKSSKLFVCRIKAKQSKPNAANVNGTISIPQISVHFHIGFFLSVCHFVWFLSSLVHTYNTWISMSMCDWAFAMQTIYRRGRSNKRINDCEYRK